MAAVAVSGPKGVTPVLVAFYAWASAVSFGLALADSGYANLLRGTVDAALAAGLFARMADFLLLTTAVTLLAAMLALAGAWGSRAARHLVIGALVLGSAQVWAPLVVPPEALAGSGTLVRLALSGSSSVLAILALGHAQRAR